MSKEELQSIIYNVRTSAQEKGNIFSLMSCALYTMSVEAFGKLGATHLWWYIFESDENKFETFDELYDFLSDPRIQYIKDTPTSLGDMIDRSPNDEMYYNLSKVIYYETIHK
jgi:hypothetical protein